MSLILEGFTVDAGRRRLLHIDALDLPSTGLIAVIGPNGAGKSTLLGALAGVIAHRGTKSLDGDWPAPERIGFMPQNFAVSAAMSAADCVLLGRRERLGWRVTAQDRAEVARALAALDLSALSDRRMDRLSGGQQQRVLLAQRLIRDPRVLILDEPTSALDMHHQLEVLDHLRALASERLVLAALHDLTLAARHADHIVFLDNGELVIAGPTAEVLRPASLNHAYRIDSEILTDRNGGAVIVAHRTVSN
ncbi:ABC transporter ATP-binding protein [Roseobacter sp. GAI101]|uniref:ABC transporter ATP-binding protein n=1 Tax=Roseobacter sp. (strain GAI101) TaxID=391589 RepID=UPI0001871735|nr:ABC transporter ATP-binding protein [Roseobacter sp. GAI101]EEB85572.1 hemin import ATP-binding protein HmuV [Roseobacter sp. GAI101]